MRIIRTYARWLAVILPVSLALTLVVPAAASTGPTATLVLTSSNSAPTFGQSITLRATLTVSGSSQSTIGQYSIFDGSTPLISGAMANFVTGYAYATSSLSVGKHTLTAKYAGTVNGLKATSNAVIVQVSPDPLSITTKSLASGVVGTAYSAQLASSGGTGKVTWKLASGSSLVTGLTLSTAGAISGTPAAATSGTGSFTVIATDSASPAHTATAPIAYTINLPQAAKPTFTVAAGTYTSAQTVSIKDATAGATIYYTTNGNTPTTASTKYTGAITVSATETIKAIATATGHSTSAVASALYTINLPVARCSGDGSGNGKIKGAYAFQLSQTYPVHSGGLGFLVGGLTADGLGNLTGSVDMNSPFGPSTGASSTAFTGNYSVGSDNRGVLNVIVPKSGGGSETLTYCVALDSISSGVAAAGRMVENDTTSGNASSGAFYAQGSGNHSLSSAKGSWVFGLQGGTAASTGTYLYRSAMAGLLALDGAGKISSGQMDISVDATLDGSNIINASFHDIGLTGSYTIAANGRGVMTITVPSSNELGGGTSHVIFWMAGPNHILLMGADPGNITTHHPVNAGEAYLRTISTFSNATLSGKSVYVSTGVSENHSTQYDQLYVEAGIDTWDGKGNLTGLSDEVDAGDVTLAANNAFTAAYSVDANGRVTAGGPVFYIIGPNRLLGVAGGLRATLTYAENQTVPAGGFTAASFNGGYSLSTFWYDAVTEPIFNGELTSGGAGSYSEVLDASFNGTAETDIHVTGNYSTSANGRFQTLVNSKPGYACYFVSPSKAYLIPINSGAKGIPFYVLNHQ